MRKSLRLPFKCLRNKDAEKIRILLVDDQEKYLDKWRCVLGENLFEITSANFPHQALEIIKKNKIDIVISDISMHLSNEITPKDKLKGEFSGIIFAKKLRELNFAGEIVLMSTGLDDFWGFLFCKFFMRYFGVDWIVPKRTLMKNNPVFYRSYLL